MNDASNLPNPARSPIESALDPILRYLTTPGRQRLAAGLALGAVVLVAYSNTIVSGLQTDERTLITTALEGGPNAELAPVGALDVGIEARLFGFNALGFRLGSIAWHLAGVVALFSIARRLAPPGPFGGILAFCAAALFAAHPAATQSVNTLTARGELLGSALALTATALILSAASEAGGRAWRRTAVGWAALGLGSAAYPAVALAAPLLPALDYAARRRIEWPVHFPAIVLVLLTTSLRGLMHSLDASAAASGGTTFTLAAIRTVVAPLDLLVYHAPHDPGAAGTLAWIALFAVGLGLFALRPALGIGLLWIALVIWFAPTEASDATSFDESQVYLAIAGAALFLVGFFGLPRPFVFRVSLVLFVTLILLGAIAVTSTRNNVWRSEAAIWLQAYEACPECAVPADRLGRLHAEQAARDLANAGAASELAADVRGHLELAVDLLRTADAAGDPLADRGLVRANALRLLGRPLESSAVLQETFARFPTNSDVLAALAELELAPGSGSRDAARQAVRYFRAADWGDPGLTPASQLRWAYALASLGNWVEASAALNRLDADPDAAVPALAAEVAGRLQGAQAAQGAYFQMASRLSPADHAAVAATVLVAEGHYQLAAQSARATLAQYPNATLAWMVVGLAEWYGGRLAQFIDEGVPESFTGDPSDRWNEFVRYLAQAGELSAAERVARDALGLTEFEACMRIAAVAIEFQRTTAAAGYLRRATALQPDDPAPWLRLAELAIAAQQADAAREAIAAAEQRGAPVEALNSLKARAGLSTTDPQGLRRTIIR